MHLKIGESRTVGFRPFLLSAAIMWVPALLLSWPSHGPWQAFLLLWVLATLAVWMSGMNDLQLWYCRIPFLQYRSKTEALIPRERWWAGHHTMWLSYYPLKDHGVVSKYLAVLLIHHRFSEEQIIGKRPSAAQVEYWTMLERQYARLGYEPLDLGDVQFAVKGGCTPDGLAVKHQGRPKYHLKKFLEHAWQYTGTAYPGL